MTFVILFYFYLCLCVWLNHLEYMWFIFRSFFKRRAWFQWDFLNKGSTANKWSLKIKRIYLHIHEVSLYPHPRNKRSSSWDGQKRTSVSSMIWFCHPSSPGGPCTSSLWGWRRGRCLCCGRTTPRGLEGQTPPYGSADNASLDGPVKKMLHIWFNVCWSKSKSSPKSSWASYKSGCKCFRSLNAYH